MRKQIVAWVVVCLLMSIAIGGCASMQTVKVPETPKYPDRPITVIVPFSAGSGLDLIGRALEKYAPKYLGQPLAVINKPGAAGTLGFNELVAANPDGYTIGISSVEIILNPLYGSTKYQYSTALTPLARVATSVSMLVSLTDQPWSNLTELIAYDKQHPDQLKFGHPGIGSLSHIVGEAFVKRSDATIKQVPFQGGGEVVAALLGGHIQTAVVNPVLVKEYIKNGSIRVLAVSGEERLQDPVFAQAPTFKEQGIDVVFNTWFGVAAPKELPPTVKTKLTEGLKSMITDPEFKKNIENMGLQLNYLDPKETEKQWIVDGQKLTKTVHETGILDRIKSQKQ